MFQRRLALLALTSPFLAALMPAQSASKVDFAKDVMPILRQNCAGCHGPAQQISGFRVDRRSIVINRRGVVPGSSENSFLFHRISGNEYGMQMPPTGALRPEQLQTIKNWIDQGAEWPDSLANEADLPPLDPKAVAMVESLRAGNLQAFLSAASDDPKLLNTRGPEGSTPFMYAVLYTSPSTLEKLLELGADSNKPNDAKATALMWAAADFDKTRLLLQHGADVNARSSDMRTPLMIAARRPGNSATVKLLLDRGAKPNPNDHPAVESSPLTEAATAGDAASVELLLSHGADAKAAGEPALAMAVAMRCARCFDLLMQKDLGKDAYTAALAEVAGLGDLKGVRAILDRGADVNSFDPLGRTPLMYAAGSDILPLDTVKLLVERGADVNARDAHKEGGDSGLTVLDIAKLRGDTPIVEFLKKAGARPGPESAPVLKVRRGNTIARAIQDSLPLIQRADANFIPKAACASCHNNSFAAMAVSAARSRGFRVDETTAAQQVKANVFGLEKLRDVLHQGFFNPVEEYFGPGVLSYMLIGLDAEHYKADLNTDAVAIFLKNRQSPDGQWAYVTADLRPPICSDYIGQTALSIRALQLYTPNTADKSAYADAIEKALAWIMKTKPNGNDDRAWRVTALAWGGKKDAAQIALRELLATQKADGGWSDIDTMNSGVYATGRALYALQVAGVPASNTAYARGIQYLLKTQQEDGSWFVQSRALAFQPYFDAGFPHGYNQWISAAGTSWAAIALSYASGPATTVAAR
jgi:ankyrin repeat protein